MEKPINISNMTDFVQEWFKKIDGQARVYHEYRTRADRVIDIYRGVRPNSVNSSLEIDGSRSSFNMLYSNTELMRPLLYNRTPEPEGRAFDQNDTPARAAAATLEKAVKVSCQAYDFDHTILSVIDDYLLAGTGIVRIDYQPIIEQNKKTEDEKILAEEVKATYLNWRDVIFGAARKWEELPWIAIRGLMTKDEVKDMFGAKKANELTYNEENIRSDVDRDTNTSDIAEETIEEAIEVFEIWDKESRQRIFLTRERTAPLQVDDDPLKLRDFFPIPRPLYSITTNDTLIPVPFFIPYQDLQSELEIVSTRIRNLTRELKRRGVVNGGVSNAKDIISAKDNVFITVENWDRFHEKGGIDAIILEVDITRIAQVIQGLSQRIEQIKQQIFEITGLSDILRAQTNPNETLGAQKLKSDFGTLRISSMQREVQRFIRDIFRMKAEVIAEQFQIESIMQISGRSETEVKVIVNNFLREQETRHVSIDIQTDSTIEANETEEQARSVAFVNAMTDFSQALPQIASTFGIEVASSLTKDIISKFKLSRGVMFELDRQIERVRAEQKELEENPPEEQPDPETIKAQLEAQKMQFEQAKFQAEFQLKQQQMQIDAQQKQADSRLKIAELQLKQQELQVKTSKTVSDIELGEFDASLAAAKLSLQGQKLDIEGANPNVNVVVGV